MKNAKRKKKGARPAKKSGKGVGSVLNKVEGEEEIEKRKREVLERLEEVFSLTSIDEATSALNKANGDPDKAAELLSCLVENVENPASSSMSTCSMSSRVSGSNSGSSTVSEGSMDTNCLQDFRCGRVSKQKKVVAATGTVSTVLGKDYVRRNVTRRKGFSNEVVDKEEAEQFLCSMLGDVCELSLGVVRDVLCQCGYDVEKALNVLLDLCSSSSEQFSNDRCLDDKVDSRNDMHFLTGESDNLTDRTSENASYSSDGELSDNIWSKGYAFRDYARVVASSEAPLSTGLGNIESDIPRKVLESLFNITKSTEHDKRTMNWRNVVKKMQSLGPEFNACHSGPDTEPHAYANGDEYHMCRQSAKKHWDSMRSYYQKASEAFTKGDRNYASYLSDQGRAQTNLAQWADEKASHDIFKARNKGIENIITIDLHGQHVKPALRMLKMHLLFGTYVPSIQKLRVITGCGSHGIGKSILKQSVIKLLKKEDVEWSEENRGTVLIKLSGFREFSFVDSDDDIASD